MTTCRVCKNSKPDDQFHRDRTKKNGRGTICKSCATTVHRAYYLTHKEHIDAYQAAHRNANPKAYRAWKLKRQYGLSRTAYESLVLSQDDCCAICQKQTALVVDHDHQTNEVRGLLCGPCNLMLGHAADNETTLQLGAAYLSRHERRNLKSA